MFMLVNDYKELTFHLWSRNFSLYITNIYGVQSPLFIHIINDDSSCVLSHFSHDLLFATHGLEPGGLEPTRLLCLWDSPGKNTRVVCHFLLQGIFLTQGSNLGLLHGRQVLYHLSCQGSSYTVLEDQ